MICCTRIQAWLTESRRARCSFSGCFYLIDRTQQMDYAVVKLLILWAQMLVLLLGFVLLLYLRLYRLGSFCFRSRGLTNFSESCSDCLVHAFANGNKLLVECFLNLANRVSVHRFLWKLDMLVFWRDLLLTGESIQLGDLGLEGCDLSFLFLNSLIGFDLYRKISVPLISLLIEAQHSFDTPTLTMIDVIVQIYWIIKN